MNKYMSNGWRTPGTKILTDDEINMIKFEIHAIGADLSVFVFNDENHINTCYNDKEDKIYIRGDILPDTRYASNITRDLMSVRAVLAHEYYGHRPHREEYLRDAKIGMKTIPTWEDEYRASYEVAKYSPNLSDLDRYHLIQDAIDRKKEANQVVELDDFMRETLYGSYALNINSKPQQYDDNQLGDDSYER